MSTYRIISSAEKNMLDQISMPNLMEYTGRVASEVRLAGTNEELRAFKYVQQKLDEFGLTTEMGFHPAYISLPGETSLEIGGEKYSCITHAMAASVEKLEGDICLSDLKSLGKGNESALRDRIVVVEGVARPPSVDKMIKLGVKGAVFVNGAFTQEMIVSQVWGNPTPETARLLPSIPVVSVNRETGERITRAVQSGKTRAVLSTAVDTGFRKIPFLTAELRGSDDPESYVLFSGHIDSWHYGVMDNGTANAVMLEVARIMSWRKDKLKRSLKLAFWSGHSHGRYAGSAYYADSHWESLSKHCIAHINIDSVGAKGAAVLKNGSCMAETRGLARDVIGTLTGQEFTGKRIGRSGDQSFWGAGVPSLFVSLSEQEYSDDPFVQTKVNPGGLGWWWHTTEDKLDKIDPDNLRRDCSIYLLTVQRLLEDLILPLDQASAAEEIALQITEWQAKAGTHFDLSKTIRLAEKTRDLAQLLNQLSGQITAEQTERARILNSCLMELSRYFVPLSYVRGSRFEHDPAMPQPPIPKLAEMDKLIHASLDSTEYHFLQTSLRCKRNEIHDLLSRSILLLEAVLSTNTAGGIM
jgi:hypothetical protein